MVKYLNLLRYFINVEKIGICQHTGTVVFHGITSDKTTNNFGYERGPSYDLTNTDLVISEVKSHDNENESILNDTMSVCIINNGNINIQTVTGLKGLFSLLDTNYSDDNVKVLYTDEADVEITKQLGFYRNFITKLLTIKDLTIIEYDEDIQYIKYRYRYPDGTFCVSELVGTLKYMNRNYVPAFKITTIGGEIMVGLNVVHTHWVYDFNDFKEYLKATGNESRMTI